MLAGPVLVTTRLLAAVGVTVIGGVVLVQVPTVGQPPPVAVAVLLTLLPARAAVAVTVSVNAVNAAVFAGTSVVRVQVTLCPLTEQVKPLLPMALLIVKPVATVSLSVIGWVAAAAPVLASVMT